MPLDDFQEPTYFEKLEAKTEQKKGLLTFKSYRNCLLALANIYLIYTLTISINILNSLRNGNTPARIEQQYQISRNQSPLRWLAVDVLSRPGRKLAYKLYRP